MEGIALSQDATTLVNVLTCAPACQDALVALLRENMDRVIATLDGWVSSSLVVGADGSRVIIVSQWRDADAVKGMQTDERMLAYFPRIKALASFESTAGVIVHARAA